MGTPSGVDRGAFALVVVAAARAHRLRSCSLWRGADGPSLGGRAATAADALSDVVWRGDGIADEAEGIADLGGSARLARARRRRGTAAAALLDVGGGTTDALAAEGTVDAVAVAAALHALGGGAHFACSAVGVGAALGVVLAP